MPKPSTIDALLCDKNSIALVIKNHRHPKTDVSRQVRKGCWNGILFCGYFWMAFMYDLIPSRISDKEATLYLFAIAVLLLLIEKYLRFRIETKGTTETIDLLSSTSSDLATARLVCYGTTEELNALIRFSHTFVKPVTFTGPRKSFRISSPNSPYNVRFLLASLIPFSILVLIYMLLPKQLIVFVSISIGYLILTAIELGRAVYYRISPGQLDVLVVDNFWSKTRLEVAIPLNEVNIVCRYDLFNLELSQSASENDNRKFVVLLGGLNKAHEFVKYVFYAARFHRTGVELPNDSIEG